MERGQHGAPPAAGRRLTVPIRRPSPGRRSAPRRTIRTAIGAHCSGLVERRNNRRPGPVYFVTSITLGRRRVRSSPRQYPAAGAFLCCAVLSFATLSCAAAADAPSRPAVVELFTSDYLTVDPDHAPIRWSLTDPRRQTLWGHPAPASWFNEGSVFSGVVPREPALAAQPIVAM